MVFSNTTLSQEKNAKLLEQADDLRVLGPKKTRLLLHTVDKDRLNSHQKDLFQYLVAHNLLVNGKSHEAITNLQTLASKKSLDVIKLINLRALSTLVDAYATTKDWPKALKMAYLLQIIIDDYQSLTPEINEHFRLGLIKFYNAIGEYKLAIEVAKSFQDINTTLRTICIIKEERLYSLIKIHPKELQTKEFIETFKLCEPLNSPILLNVAKGYYATHLLELGKPNKALAVLESRLPSVKANEYQVLINQYYDLLAKTHLALKNYPQAKRYAADLLDTEQQHHYFPAITIAYEVLAEVNASRENYEQAFYYFKQYFEAHQIELELNNAKLLSMQQKKLEVIDKNTQIVLSNNRNTLLKTQDLLHSKSAQNKRLALALFIMTIVILILWAYKNRRIYLKMRYFSQTDELTGTANRHHFAQLAFSAIELCKQTQQPVSFVIFNLDYFKKINDNYGHIVGDKALKMAVNAAKSACRTNDIIGRLGGEEFGILLAGCGDHLAAHIAEKCRIAIENLDTSGCGHQFTLTASFGVSDSSVCGYEFTTLFAGADKALFQSKDLGRNQVFNY